jgi:hypothetical protein
LNIPRITVVGSYATSLTMKVKRLPIAGDTFLGSGSRADGIFMKASIRLNPSWKF